VNRISVIVVDHGAGDLLAGCLDSLARQDRRPDEIVVVDSGSPGGPSRAVAGRTGVRLVCLPGNAGFGAGVNRGIRETTSELVALLNPDATAEPGWLAALEEAARAHPRHSWFASRVLARERSARERSARERSERSPTPVAEVAPPGSPASPGRPPLLDSAGHTLTLAGRGLKIGEGEADGPAVDTPRVVLGAPASASLYRRSALADVGPFTERYHLVMEDVHWDLRAVARGHACLYVPGARVQHRVSSLRGRGSDLSVYLEERNTLMLLAELVPLGLIARMAVPLALHQAWSLIVKLRRGQIGPHLAGLAHALAALPRSLALRRQHAASGSLPATEQLAPLIDAGWHRRRIATLVGRARERTDRPR
jgi:GT2 family glycosyltransferase